MKGLGHRTALCAAIAVIAALCPASLSGQQAADTATIMAGLVTEFRAGETLAEWHARHPADTVEAFEINEQAIYTGAGGEWCGRAIQNVTTAAGRRVQRYAYFYVPQPSAGQALPQAGDDPELTAQCRLGHLWVETAETDRAAGLTLARELSTALEKRLGPAERGVQTLFFGSAAWEEQARWRKGEITTVSAYDKTLAGTSGRRVLGFTTTPAAQEVSDTREESDFRRTRRIMREVERANGLAERAAELERLLDTMPEAPCSDGAEPAAALSRWMQAAANWTGERKAAALLLADLTVANMEHCFQQEKSAAKERVSKLGAVFEYSELGASWVYVHNWLRQAAELPGAGATGEIAFAEWMSTGFQQHCCCLGQDFRRVISRGEEFLRQKHAPAIEARVHFLTADAYRDIVALAGGAGDIYAEAQEYRPEAASARRKAIAHYRAGLKIESGSEEARAAWRSAWRLIAGLGTPDLRFFCVYD